MKTCSRCKKEKPLSEYNRKGEGRTQSHCKACQKSWYDNYYRTNSKEKERLARKRATERQAIRELIIKEKSNPCMDCGVEYPPYVMDFDHRDPKIKLFNVSSYGSLTLNQIKKEIEKCDVVCANCHRIRTYS